MNINEFTKAPGHWILARMGKRVLRPGGKELTEQLIKELNISPNDDIVEYAPGLGFTAGIALRNNPKSYVGVDADEDVINLLQNKIIQNNVQFILRNASDTKLDSESKDKLYAEAMLTMHADHQKSDIIKEANRILKKGGIYAIHEIGLLEVDDNLKNAIQKELSTTIRVNARPLTIKEWTELLENNGFLVKKIMTNDMYLLELKRLIDDEGFFRFLKIVCNILRYKQARIRILDMRKVFRKYQKHLNAVAILAEKI